MLPSRLGFGLVAMLIATLVPDDPFGEAFESLSVSADATQGARGGPLPTPTGSPGSMATPRPSPAHLDHFMSYGVKSSKGADPFAPRGPVSLPRLGGGPYDLSKVATLLLPANKNGGGVHDTATHLLEYRLKPSKGARKFSGLANVRVLNQCSDIVVELTKPVALLVPTAKSLAGPATPLANPTVDHLLCFEAKAQKKGPGGATLPKFPKGVQVQVADQFQSRRYALTKVTRLCLPTAKGGTPVFRKGATKGNPAPLAPATVQHTDEHLLCYKAKLATTEVEQAVCGPANPQAKAPKIPKQPKHTPRVGVSVANQLGAQRLDTTKDIELCVPSVAELPIVEGLLTLPGDPQQLVSDATFDLSRSPGWTAAETTLDASGSRILRTRLGIFFTDDATVGAANALLARLGAEIVMMVAGPPYVVVRIPDPGTLDALRALAADVETDPAVDDVSLDAIPELDLLPSNFPRPAGDLGQEQGLLYIDHLLQARAAPAWNARAAIKQPPAVVIADAFGDGPPGASISAAYPVPSDFAVGNPNPLGHGYQVLGVIAATFGNEFGPANCFTAPLGPDSVGCATGIYPGNEPPRVRVVDVQKRSWNETEVAILTAVKELKPDRAVVNVSMGRREIYGDLEAARVERKRWIKLVRRAGLEQQFLLVAAAGNITPDVEARDAKTSSSFTAASLLGAEVGSSDPPALENVLVIENRKDSRFPFRPGGLHEATKLGGHLSACGTNVWTVQAPLTAFPNGWTGTSYSAPLVAGTAAYVLSIAPELSIEEVRKLLLDNAQPQAAGTTPALDAYATLLDIDRITNSGEPVRRAILDYVASGEINADDVLAFFADFHDLTPERRRWGRGDLRGAYEPQTDAVRFDLDLDGHFETINLQVGTHQLQFDEQMVSTDADIVCYTAFSTTGPYQASGRVDPGRDRCCTHYKQIGRLPPDAKCFNCPARGRGARIITLEDEPKPVGIWHLSVPSGLVVYDLFFLEDGTVMLPAQSGLWEKGGTWTSTPHEVNGEILYYDVRIDACTDAIQHTRYAFEGTWSPRPVTDCFGVESCFDGDSCPAMQGLLTTSDGITTSPPVAVDSKRVQGSDGWEALTPPEIHQCHGGCFEEWRRTGLLACSPVGQHCLEQTAPTCGGVCLPGSACTNDGGSCTCVAD